MSTLKQFEGRTVEEALERASAELGPEVSLTDATRDRRGGVFGFFTKERFTVTAVDPSGDETVAERDPNRRDVDSFSRVLNAMVDDVDDVAERSIEATPSAEGKSSDPEPGSGPLVDLVNLTAQQGQRRTTIDLSEGRRLPSSDTEETEVIGGANQPRERAALFAAVVSAKEQSGEQREIEVVAPPIVSARKSKPEPSNKIESVVRGSGIQVVEPPLAKQAAVAEPVVEEVTTRQQTWSLERLASLGIPEQILQRLETDEVRSDLEWAAALERVIGEILDRLEPSSTIHVFGTGLESASELLVAAVAGLAPDHLLIDDHRIPATATELALAIRECLR